MNKFVIALLTSAVIGMAPAFAEDASGPERMGEGAVDAVTSPGQIVEGLEEETEKRGPGGWHRYRRGERRRGGGWSSSERRGKCWRRCRRNGTEPDYRRLVSSVLSAVP